MVRDLIQVLKDEFSFSIIEWKDNYMLASGLTEEIDMMQKFSYFVLRQDLKIKKSLTVHNRDEDINEIWKKAFIEARIKRGLAIPQEGNLLMINEFTKTQINPNPKTVPKKKMKTLTELRAVERVNNQKILGKECFELTNQYLL